MTVEYYRQRATAALIISEAAQISQQAQGYAWTPGIYTDEQAAGWRKVAQAVHAQGGHIILGLRQRWSARLILAGGYDRASASTALADGRGDLIAFGRPFIANPDLPERLLRDAALNAADSSSFFGGTDIGYTDYPVLS